MSTRQIILLFTALLVSGCATIHETSPPPIDLSQKIDMNLRTEGFELLTLQQTGSYHGASYGGAYNYQTGAYVSGNTSTIGNIYERQKDCGFSDFTSDAFEKLGFNIRSNKPDLILVGRVGNGRFPWNAPALYYRDFPVFIFAVATLGSVISCTRENNIQVIVYSADGKRLKEYYACQSYNAFSIAFPFANFANEKAYEWYGDRQSASFALIDCINQFVTDCKSGYFNEVIGAEQP